MLKDNIERTTIRLIENGQNGLPSWSVAISAITLARLTNTTPTKALELAPRHLTINGVALEAKTEIGHARFKACTRRSVLEPPIKGVRSPGKSLDEKKLRRLLKADAIARTKLVFVPTEQTDTGHDAQRAAIKERLANRWAQKTEKEHKPVKDFTPEHIIFGENGDTLNPLMEKRVGNFADLVSTDNPNIFPPVPTIGKMRERISTFIGSMCSHPSPALVNKVLREEKIVFAVAALPCLNPSPLITDHPEKNIGLNVPTVLFLLRLNHFATELTKALGKRTTVKIISEISLMDKMFSFLTPEQIENGKHQLIALLSRLHLGNLELCFARCDPPATDLTSFNDSDNFIGTFRKGQFDSQIPMSLMLHWLGITEKPDLDSSDFQIQIEQMEQQARSQAKSWAAMSHGVRQESFCPTDIQLSIRPGSSVLLKFVPVTNHQTEKTPMLPQHCNVAIRKDQSLLAAKRVEFLLNPNKWTEIETEFGSLFIEK